MWTRASKPKSGRVNVLPFPYVRNGDYYTRKSDEDASIECISVASIKGPCHLVPDHDHAHHFYVNDMLYMFDNVDATLWD